MKNTDRLFKIEENYFGKFDTISCIAQCDCLADAIMIVDSLLVFKKGRPFAYRIVQNFDVNFEDQFIYEWFGEIIDKSEYKDWMYCL